MLLAKQTLLKCSLDSGSCTLSIRVGRLLCCRSLSSDSISGAASSSTSPVDSTARKGHNNSHQPRQQRAQAVQQAAQLKTHQLHSQQHQTHHQLHNRQLHPKPYLQVVPMQQFEVVSETPVHSRYLSVFDRKVKFCAAENPTECRVLDFDVVGHPRANFRFAVTFPYHPYKDGRKGGEVTLIREYAQGPNELMYCLPTGGLDPQRHADIAECAARELSEEAWLAGGAWHRLLPVEHPGLPEVKWCMNRFVPFLVVDPQQDPNPGSRDAEEASMEVLRVPLEQFRRLMISGDLMLPSITTAYLALDKLKEEGYL